MSGAEVLREALKKFKKDATLLELGGVKFAEFSPEAGAALAEYKDVKMLVVSNCGLKSLQGLPKWELTAIDASGNQYACHHPGSLTILLVCWEKSDLSTRSCSRTTSFRVLKRPSTWATSRTSPRSISRTTP